MTLHLNSQADLEDAIRALLKLDARLQPVFAVAGMPALRRREPGFMGLAHIVCGQQLSTASASAIWARLTAAFDPFHHDALRRARADRRGSPLFRDRVPATAGFALTRPFRRGGAAGLADEGGGGAGHDSTIAGASSSRLKCVRIERRSTSVHGL